MPDFMEKKQVKVFTTMSKKNLVVLAAFACFLSCDKNNTVQNTDFFPPVLVDFYVNLSLPDAAALQFNGGYIYRTGVGYRGIIIYNMFDNYTAFDRTCPYKVDSACSYVSVDSSATKMRCGQYKPTFVKCCDSEFNMTDGSVHKGPASRPLKQYYVSVATGQLHVTSFPQ